MYIFYLCLLFYRLNFSTAFSTNAVSICHSVGLSSVTRVEMSRRYLIVFGDITATGPRVPSGDEAIVTKDVEDALVAKLHDRMTECRYTSPITTFDLDIQPDDVYDVDIMGNGKEALEKANQELGMWYVQSAFRKLKYASTRDLTYAGNIFV